ncbi:F-box only protein 41-like [Sinocyclocheilus grahami]|uniref:F-box only protein 41-like n=1 Tax=Sinocyclocheilus grahami TaxID=75366 RepID=UPI0007AC9515|nr:PREDICTED: F-box only protein 41-like [Sinocyclocheilus grahami]
MSTSTELPLCCPTCGEACGFGEHLSSARSCQKLCLTPRRSSEGRLMSLYAQRESKIDRPLRLELLDALSLARPLRKILIQRDLPSSLSPVLAVAMSSRAAEAEADAGHAVAQLGVPWLGRLALEARLQQLALEVQERVSLKLETLQYELQRRSVEVRRARRESECMHREKRHAEERAAELERQVDISVEMLASLRYELRERDEQLRRKQQFLMTLSQWCCQTQSLVLHNLKPRSRGKKESKDEYLRSTRGGLEAGLEAVLKSAGRCLIALRVSHCPNILTDRSLWVVSCHCRALQSLTYRSASDPAGQEVIWALGAGCRNITTLRIAPLQPCLQPSRFSNRCLQTIGRCWPNLCRVGVGGASCGVQGLASLVRNCVNLCELELDHMNELNQEAAAEICRDGLQQLHTLSFISSPVTARAILRFSSVCMSLKCVVVQLSISDYFEDANNEEAKRLFEEIQISSKNNFMK